MKKEIKKLQRLRDYFKAMMNNAEVKDKSKLLEAKR
jgi:CCR4-NOT transcriptional regulation complex NOT5 subunit